MKYVFVTSLFIISILSGIHPAYLNAQEQYQTQEQQTTGEETEGGQELVLTEKPLEIWTFIDDYRLITGKTLHLTVQVMWKLGVTVNLEDVDKIDLSPFRIESATIGERQIFDNEHDYLVITYTLTLPASVKEGLHSIPSFSLSYTNEIDKSEGKATSSPIVIKKVPMLVDGKVDKDVITIGDRINYTLTIRHEKNVNLIWESIEKLNFSPFEILKRDMEKETEGNIEKVMINYTLSLFELVGKKKTPEIPELIILYYAQPQSSQGATKTDNTQIETKEVKTTSIPIILNSLLKAVDVPLEGLKGPMYYSKKGLFLNGYLMLGLGIGLLLFLGVITLRSVSGRITPPSQIPLTETPRVALERLQHLITTFKYANTDRINKENIHNIDRALRTYLGALIGISNEISQSVTTTDFFNYDTQKRLTDEISTTARTVLKQIDTVVYGRQIKKEMVDKILQGIEEIIKQTSPMFAKH